MEFSALNVDFSSSSPDLLGSRRPSHAGVKKGTPIKGRYFTAIGSFSALQIDIDLFFAVTITSDKLLIIQH